MADERSVMFPDVPTFKELGYDMVIRSWACVVAPKDTPAEVLEVLRKAAEETCADKEYQEYLLAQGIDPVSIIGDDCYEMMKADHEMFGTVLATLDLSTDFSRADRSSPARGPRPQPYSTSTWER